VKITADATILRRVINVSVLKVIVADDVKVSLILLWLVKFKHELS